MQVDFWVRCQASLWSAHYSIRHSSAGPTFPVAHRKWMLGGGWLNMIGAVFRFQSRLLCYFFGVTRIVGWDGVWWWYEVRSEESHLVEWVALTNTPTTGFRPQHARCLPINRWLRIAYRLPHNNNNNHNTTTTTQGRWSEQGGDRQQGISLYVGKPTPPSRLAVVFLWSELAMCQEDFWCLVRSFVFGNAF